jgi:hypothetical protein
MAVLSVPIKLDKERNLKLGFSAMIALEKLFPGKSFFDLMSEYQNKPTISMVVNIVYAGLIHEDGKLTPDKVAKLLDDSELEDLLGIINKAFETSQGPELGNAEAGEVKE